MSRQLIDVLEELLTHDNYAHRSDEGMADLLVSLLTHGPATHTIVCPTCGGGTPQPWAPDGRTCPDCTNGRQTIVVKAEIVRAVTATGRQMTDSDFEALADEAERGYDVRGLENVEWRRFDER